MKDGIKVWIDPENPSIQRIKEKCINCGMCLNVCMNEVGVDRNKETAVPLCINCGMCIMNCPMAALREKYDYKKVLNIVKDTDKIVTISVAPAVRVTLMEELKGEIGLSIENKLPSILRAIGFDYVFDVTFGADVTIMEEASELVSRIRDGGPLPMFTSCCPSWVKYASIFHPEILPNISTTKSPIAIMSALTKTYFKEMNAIDKEVVTVAIAPCTAKKYEALNNDTDYVITTRELAMMIRECEIDIDGLKSSEFDPLMNKGSKKGLIFGRSGGVMEAALSTTSYLLTGKNPKPDEFHIDITEPITEKSYKIGDKIINIAIVQGMKNIEKVLNDKDKYDFVEVMNCPNGCVGGGGQPLVPKQEIDSRRIARKNTIDEDINNVNFSHENKAVEELYKSYLQSPLSLKSEHILHTTHRDLSDFIKKEK